MLTFNLNMKSFISFHRVMAICDPETDEEAGNKEHNPIYQNDKTNRRKLSFSDDENSATSEFDPEDVVPPKSLPKKSMHNST